MAEAARDHGDQNSLNFDNVYVFATSIALGGILVIIVSLAEAAQTPEFLKWLRTEIGNDLLRK
jgi:hypothetical protein